MTPSNNPRTTNSAPWIAAAVVGFVFCGLVIWCIVGITGYFRLSSETAALRSSVMQSMPGTWDKKIALRVGGMTTGLVRFGASFFQMPREPRAALNALRGAEVGIYQLEDELGQINGVAVLNAADRAMKSRGWERIVGVATERELVAVYWPQKKVSARAVKCCVVVFEGKEMILTAVRGNLEPLMELAHEHINLTELQRHMPGRLHVADIRD